MRDVLTIGILAFVISVIFLLLYSMLNPMFTALSAVPEVNASSLASASIKAGQTNLLDRFDYMVLFIFLGFVIAALITSWFIAGIPLFMFIYFLFLVIIGVVMSVLSYTWTKIATATPTFISIVATKMPITDHLMENFLLYMIALGFLSMIVMYAKPQQY